MTKIALFTFALCALASGTANAGHVNGYMRSNGTYVAPYERSAPDNSVQNNYSYQGNTNPSTGATGTNRYEHDTTSPYFNGTPYSNGRYGHQNSYGQ